MQAHLLKASIYPAEQSGLPRNLSEKRQVYDILKSSDRRAQVAENERVDRMLAVIH